MGIKKPGALSKRQTEHPYEVNSMSKILQFKTKKEEREFWASHSSADYWDDMEACDDTFKKAKLKSVSLKLDPGLLERLKVIAHKRGLS